MEVEDSDDVSAKDNAPSIAENDQMEFSNVTIEESGNDNSPLLAQNDQMEAAEGNRQPKCVICSSVKWSNVRGLRKRQSLVVCRNTSDFKKLASEKNDFHLLTAIESAVQQNIKIVYHKTCYLAQQRKSPFTNKNQSNEISREEAHKIAYDKCKLFIQKTARKQKTLTMNKVKQVYLSEYNKVRLDHPIKKVKIDLKLPLSKDFPELVVFQPKINRTAVIIPPQMFNQDDLNVSINTESETATNSNASIMNQVSTSEICASNVETRLQEENQRLLFHASNILRSSIENIPNSEVWPPSPHDLTLKAAEEMIPTMLYNFIASCCGKTDTLSHDNFAKNDHHSQILSICQDIVGVATNIQSPKSLALGMTVHNLTRSHTLLNVLNGLGHSVSASSVIRLQTGYAQQQNSEIPENIHPNIFSTLVWDNIDFNEETRTGKGTSHYTNGIIVQRVTSEYVSPYPQRTKSVLRKDVRKCDLPAPNLEHHIPNPSNQRNPNVGPVVVPIEFQKEVENAIKLDFHYIVAKYCHQENADLPILPHWTKYNSLFGENQSQVEKSTIGYLTPIQAPATESDTVLTILKRSIHIADELALEKIVLVFDLALYAKAQNIRWDNVIFTSRLILRLGEFHICLSFMQCIWKRFSGSGIEQLFTESGIFAEGSINSMMNGHHYNRSMKGLEILYESFSRICYKKFSAQFQESEEVEKAIAYQNFISDQCTSSDSFRFWYSLVEMIEILLCFKRATRSNNWILHLASVEMIIPWMFAYDHHNYARYLSTYLCEMMSYQHDTIWENLSHQFTVKRSEGSFNCVAFDQTIEQTLNRDCKVGGGLIGITKKKNAINRWILCQSERQEITQNCMDMANCSRNSHSQGSSEEKIHEDNVLSVISTLEAFINPFEDGITAITNIMTGAGLTDEITNDLLNAHNLGKSGYNSFMVERFENRSKALSEPIRKNKLKTFSDAGKVRKFTTSQKLQINLKADKKIFSRMLVLCQKKKLDLKAILKYTLNALPLCICNVDGTLVTTEKSKLLHHLEIVANKFDGEKDAALVVDGMGLLHSSMFKSNATFNEIADYLLKTIVGICKSNGCIRCDFVTDTYKENSIKSEEHEKRMRSNAITFNVIQGTSEVKNWSTFLSVGQNKNLFTEFLFERWCMASSVGGLQLYVSHGGECHLLEKVGEKIQVTEIPDLKCDHEEGDTKAILHANHAAKSVSKVLISTPDTDVIILAMCLLTHGEISIRTGTKKHLRFLSVTEMQKKWASSVETEALIGFHIFTGSDCTSAFKNKAKIQPLKIMINNLNYLSAFSELGKEFNDVSAETKVTLQRFVCEVYGCKSTNLSDARYEIFQARGCSDDLLPPTEDVFEQHLKRANYYTAIMRSAKVQFIQAPSPTLHGWDETYRPVWLTEIAPDDLLKNIQCNCKTGCKNNRCSCVKNNMKCSMCGCTSCENDENVHNDDEEEIFFEEEAEADSDFD